MGPAAREFDRDSAFQPDRPGFLHPFEGMDVNGGQRLCQRQGIVDARRDPRPGTV
jgi:hypothetical protein